MSTAKNLAIMKHILEVFARMHASADLSGLVEAAP